MILTKYYRKVYDREDEIKRATLLKKPPMEAARQAERERRAAEGIKEYKPSTSKKKLATQQKITASSTTHEKPLEKMSPKELAEYWGIIAAEEEGKSKKAATNRPEKYSIRPELRPEQISIQCLYAAEKQSENIETAPLAAANIPGSCSRRRYRRCQCG
jgi:hypothetical protein